MTSPLSGAAGDTSSTGLSANVAGAIAYLLGPITGVILLIIEKESRFVRFHAAQSTVLGVAMVVVSIVLSILTTILAVVPILGWLAAILLNFVFSLACFVLWIVLMWKAFNGEEWEFPIAGAYARSMIK
ncbi:MAG: DUF4870 domain-containing protein [Gemmatimonadaceae bacterium]|nr:DUF4870 domain-containing protein [Gemmatimonadaceae bacterium]